MGKEGKEKGDDDKAKAKDASAGEKKPPVDASLDHRKLFKEGQKFLTPPVADATRAFYESLYAENPDSKIAIRFCIEYGVLAMEDHKKLLSKYNKLKDKGAFSMQAQIKKAIEKMGKKKEGKDKKA